VLVGARNELIARKALNKGILGILKNWTSDRKIQLLDSDIYGIKYDYEKAIDDVVWKYKKKAKDLHDSYGGWYDSNSVFLKTNLKLVADPIQF
jgi:hypothetical protein